MASDFHTHNTTRNNIPALISSEKILPDKLFSLQIHPWHLPEKYTPLSPEIKDRLSAASALGEIGLDKIHGTNYQTQQKYLVELFKLASDCRKPVVLHIVKSYQELFDLLKPFDLKVMIHGFRSSPQLLQELWKRNITVSFHHRITKNDSLIKQLKNANGAFGFESDDFDDIFVEELISELSEKYKIPDLEKVTDQNFANFLEL